ncbi:TolC family protein [Olivibacter sitiensis]|uniref:TolC family protein n=1 Tax=Olivibacter sitiensis TaxID=376470 RepID=UPI0004234FF4|nr:TolC family protein [Olivibacter sitiensis]
MKTAIGKHFLYFPLLLLLCAEAGAQTAVDTISISEDRAEALFLESNLQLLAEKLNIQQADARILQAKAWPNPTFTLDEVNLWSNATVEPSPAIVGGLGRNQQFAAQLEQLLLTARKRKKNIAYEVQGKELSERMFTDLLQSLKAEFRQEMAELVYRQAIKNDLQQQYELVNELERAQSVQQAFGNISQAELMRIKALRLSLLQALHELDKELGENQKNLKTLMALPPNSYLVVQPSQPKIAELRKLDLGQLLLSAQENNLPIKVAESEKALHVAALSIENAKKVPDITAHVNYDRNGSTMLNFVGIGLSMDLPFFDRNKGNIRAAQLEVKKSEYLLTNRRLEMGHAVTKTWQDLQQSLLLYEQMDTEYIDKLSNMSAGMARQFLNRNINLLEFLDFFESFRQSKEQYYESIKNINIYREELNYLTGLSL